MRGIDTVDIKTGIGFGKALGLRVGEDIGEVQTFLFHRREDEIAGSV